MPLFNESIDVSQVIENVIGTFSVQISEKRGSFTFQKEGRKFDIAGNVDLFHIAIGNIVENAIKYCKSPPEINIHLKSNNRIVVINISDNGIGIAKDQQTQIFEKYYRVPTGDVYDNNGFGLGLYHVKNIVAKMKGKIKVSGSKGKGTTFSLEFPLYETAEKI
jgi:two-component system phosphate regulon sensor histidine kinase PhoR